MEPWKWKIALLAPPRGLLASPHHSGAVSAFIFILVTTEAVLQGPALVSKAAEATEMLSEEKEVIRHS